ncbi:MAG: hypothetical protein ACOY0T_38210 [Myxococcota bacterium]
MPVTAKRAQALALSLANTTAVPHFERLAFRTPRRIFATLGPGGRDVNFGFDPLQQAQFCAEGDGAIAPVEGGWGRMGWTHCDLDLVDLATFKRALEAAHARANEPPRRAKLKSASAAKPKPAAVKPTASAAKARAAKTGASQARAAKPKPGAVKPKPSAAPRRKK